MHGVVSIQVLFSSSSYSSSLELVILNQFANVKDLLAFFHLSLHYFLMANPKKKSTHGGKRAGAGRKPIAGDTTLVAVRVPVKLLRKLDRYAKAKKVSRSQAIIEAIDRLS
jgi:hypothetical protein